MTSHTHTQTSYTMAYLEQVEDMRLFLRIERTQDLHRGNELAVQHLCGRGRDGHDTNGEPKEQEC